MTLLLTPVLEQITALEVERAALLAPDYLTRAQAARLRQITETLLPPLWEARRQELAPKPDPAKLQEALSYDARKSTEKPRPPRLKGRPQYTRPQTACPMCNRVDAVVRNGHYVSGRQRYFCRACNTRYGDYKAA